MSSYSWRSGLLYDRVHYHNGGAALKLVLTRVRPFDRHCKAHQILSNVRTPSSLCRCKVYRESRRLLATGASVPHDSYTRKSLKLQIFTKHTSVLCIQIQCQIQQWYSTFFCQVSFLCHSKGSKCQLNIFEVSYIDYRSVNFLD